MNKPPTMMSSSIIPPLLLLLLLQSIDAWTPRLSASHFNFNSGGRFFFHNAYSSNTMMSLKATTEHNHPPEDEDTTTNNSNNSSNEEDEFKHNNSSNNKDDKKKKKKKEGTLYLTAEYLSQLESLYASSSADLTSTSSSSSTYSVKDHSGTTSSSTTSSSSPGQSLLYGEKIHTVVLGDWMEWEEGKNSYSSSSSCFGENCGDDSEQCDIPEHYKEFKGSHHPKVDVMSFLGIKRAEPIQVQRDWD